jgi:hypothetical protein
MLGEEFYYTVPQGVNRPVSLHMASGMVLSLTPLPEVYTYFI